MMPELYVVFDKDWPGFAKHKTNAAYERYGVVPGAFLDDSDPDQAKWCVYMSEHMWRQTMLQAKTDTGRPWHEHGEGLTEHELLHAWTGFDHRTTIKGGFLDAVKVGFDTRAFTRFLRLRWNKEHHEKSKAWIISNKQSWDANVLVSKPAPKV